VHVNDRQYGRPRSAHSESLRHSTQSWTPASQNGKAMKQSLSASQAMVQDRATGLQMSPAKGQCASIRHSTHRWAAVSQMVRNAPEQSTLRRHSTHWPAAPSQNGRVVDRHSSFDVQPRQVMAVASQTGRTAGHAAFVVQAVLTGVITFEARSPQEADATSAKGASTASTGASRRGDARNDNRCLTVGSPHGWNRGGAARWRA
jgi:hypothetical protein